MMLTCIFLAFVPAAFSQDCPTIEPSICIDNDVACDMGMYGNCWNGDYCMPEGSVCPPACYTPAPSVCPDSSDVVCDNGMDSNGCWMGDFCLPAGNPCPPVCYPIQPSNYSSTEVACDMGMYGNCWNGDYCMPEGHVCPPACNIPTPSVCGPTDARCDMGMDTTGCWLGDYCMPEGSECPTMADDIFT